MMKTLILNPNTIFDTLCYISIFSNVVRTALDNVTNSDITQAQLVALSSSSEKLLSKKYLQ